jgi:predicted anti-sigma-YlaC factor YlaD
MKSRPGTALLLLALASLGTGCTTLKHRAVDTLGDALAAGGTTFAADDDPQLVAAAVPFSLKLMESLLAERPQHRGLLLAAASGFTQYAFAFVQQDADEVTEKDFAAGTVLKHRARRLYLRARDYGLRGLDLAHPAFSAKLRADPRTAVRLATKADVPLLYWSAASWGAAIALSKDNADLIADQGILEALIDRAHELDADYDQGAIHAFLVAYEMARPGGAGDAAARSRRHFERALALSGGQQAGPFVSLAESVALPQQNRPEFEALLKRALAIDVDARPEFRLVNLVMQRRARWLLGRIDDLFLPAAEPAPAPTTAMLQQPGMQDVASSVRWGHGVLTAQAAAVETESRGDPPSPSLRRTGRAPRLHCAAVSKPYQFSRRAITSEMTATEQWVVGRTVLGEPSLATARRGPSLRQRLRRAGSLALPFDCLVTDNVNLPPLPLPS